MGFSIKRVGFSALLVIKSPAQLMFRVTVPVATVINRVFWPGHK